MEKKLNPNYNPKVGDVVRVHRAGGCYTSYADAIKYFKLYELKNSSYFNVDVPTDFDSINWAISDVALHSDGRTLIYKLINNRNEGIITNKKYLEHRKHITTPLLEKIKSNFLDKTPYRL